MCSYSRVEKFPAVVGIFLTSQSPSYLAGVSCISWRLPPLAAVSLVIDCHFFREQKETAALISQKPPCMNRRVKISLLYDGFFSFAVVRQIVYFNFAF